MDRPLKFVPRKIDWRCHICEASFSAVSERALSEAMDEHTRYVNHTKDRAQDEHFAEVRLDALIAK